jgi:hypothetical protein
VRYLLPRGGPLSWLPTLIATLAGVITVTLADASGAGSPDPGSQQTLHPGAKYSWVVYDSHGTEVYPIGASNGDKHGTIRWESGGRYAGSQMTYMVLGFRVVSGSPGRMFDGHTHPADAPWGWTPPGSNGVAPFAIDWFRGSGRGLEYVAEPNDWPTGTGRYHFQILTDREVDARTGQWIWLWVEIVWGRRDLSVKGAARIWIAGEDRPRVDVSGINTHWPGEGMVTFWAGTYWNTGAPKLSVIDVAAPRFGRTPKEAYEDSPSAYSRWGDGTSVALVPVGRPMPIPAPLSYGLSPPAPRPPPPPPDLAATERQLPPAPPEGHRCDWRQHGDRTTIRRPPFVAAGSMEPLLKERGPSRRQQVVERTAAG